MADRLPSAEKVRLLLSAQEFDPVQMEAHAESFFKAGQPHQALAFMEKAPDTALLERIKTVSIEEGDAFTLQWIDRIGTVSIAASDWAAAV